MEPCGPIVVGKCKGWRYGEWDSERLGSREYDPNVDCWDWIVEGES